MIDIGARSDPHGENEAVSQSDVGPVIDGPGVVVTGATSGFGLATSRLLAESGWRVFAVGRRSGLLADLVGEFPAGRITPVGLDVRDRDAVMAVLPEFHSQGDGIAALVNNAGLSKGFGPMSAAEPDDWQEMIDTNITGVLNCTHALLPGMIDRQGGHVVNVGSIAATYPYMGGNVYAATKAFVHQLSLNLRSELQGTGIRVSCVAPGMAQTGFALVRFGGDRARADALYEGVRPLSGEDVARTIEWCLAQPPHVNVNMIEVMPTEQPFALGLKAAVRESDLADV
ncbi:Serine 3-dehydrogenase [Actinobacteria bacterium OK074]|nr:Serine 3-dehydrogenase [Actinobacteria bacterium OK074]